MSDNPYEIPDIDVACLFCARVQPARNFECEVCGKGLPFKQAWIGDSFGRLVFDAIWIPALWWSSSFLIPYALVRIRAGDLIPLEWLLLIWGVVWGLMFLIYYFAGEHSAMGVLDRRRDVMNVFAPGPTRYGASLPNNDARGRAAIIPVQQIMTAWGRLAAYLHWRASN